jgi:lipopolysaccharide/colanic/teichoic acid biosynthesis glycosyltransferase/GNAT superfamily N-acetyltransferase
VSRRCKRIIDIVAALAGLLILSPLIAAIALAVVMLMGPPVLFRQVRAGLGGRPFVFLKFRTMTDERDNQGTLLSDGDRLTSLGKFLRKTSLDELPQLWNVLRGDMSLVGPRPLLMEYVPLYSASQRRRLDVLPGIVGLPAVSGRAAIPWDKRLELDSYYVDNWSLLLDLRILIKVVPTVLDVGNVSEEGEATCSRFQGSVNTDRNLMSPLPLAEQIFEDDLFVYGLVDPEQNKEQIIRSLSEIFGLQFSIAEYEWYKLHHPDCRSRVHAAHRKEDGKLAGIVCSQTFRYRFGRTEHLVDLLVSGGTYPPFRRQGLFSRLVNVIVEHGASLGVTCGISFPNPYVRNSFPAFMKAGWSVPLEYRFFEKRSFRERITSVRPVEHFDSRYDRLMEEASLEFDFFQIKDHRVLNWRYVDRPETEYTSYAVDDGMIKGLVVLKRYSDEFKKKTHMVDFMALTEDAGEQLIHAAEYHARGTDLLNMAVAVGNPLERLLQKHGFEVSARTYPMVMKTPAGIPLPELSRAWIMLGDNDSY